MCVKAAHSICGNQAYNLSTLVCILTLEQMEEITISIETDIHQENRRLCVAIMLTFNDSHSLLSN